MFFELRAARDPETLIPEVYRAMASIDPAVPVFGIKTQAQQVDELLVQERLFVKLSSFFGG